LLLPADDFRGYVEAVDRLLASEDERRQMGRAAAAYVRQVHDLEQNYSSVEDRLLEMVDASTAI
jgi:glycosyltransferase involved in cell wall biosynthesis